MASDTGRRPCPSEDDLLREVRWHQAALTQAPMARTTASLLETLDALHRLGDLPVSVLQQTMIGKAVQKLTKEPDLADDIRSRAQQLVGVWRSCFRQWKAQLGSQSDHCKVEPPQAAACTADGVQNTVDKMCASPACSGEKRTATALAGLSGGADGNSASAQGGNTGKRRRHVQDQGEPPSPDVVRRHTPSLRSDAAGRTASASSSAAVSASASSSQRPHRRANSSEMAPLLREVVSYLRSHGGRASLEEANEHVQGWWRREERKGSAPELDLAFAQAHPGMFGDEERKVKVRSARGLAVWRRAGQQLVLGGISKSVSVHAAAVPKEKRNKLKVKNDGNPRKGQRGRGRSRGGGRGIDRFGGRGVGRGHKMRKSGGGGRGRNGRFRP